MKMKLTAKLAYSQLVTQRRRTVWTLLGVALSAAMITAVCGFIASGDVMLMGLMGADYLSRTRYLTTLISLGAVLGLMVADEA